MARQARVVIPGTPHHVTQRGNRRQRTFFCEADYLAYLHLAAEAFREAEVQVWAYCLMPNHVHLIATPPRPQALAQAVGATHVRYTRQVNLRERWTGHLWQGRFASAPMDEAHLLACARYVELNPVRAGLAREAAAYRWSSAAAHLGAKDRWELLSMRDWLKCWNPEEWSEILNGGIEENAGIREATYGGWPLGSEEFVGRLEVYLKRRLRRGNPGRPRKTAHDPAKASGGSIGEI